MVWWRWSCRDGFTTVSSLDGYTHITGVWQLIWVWNWRLRGSGDYRVYHSWEESVWENSSTSLTQGELESLLQCTELIQTTGTTRSICPTWGRSAATFSANLVAEAARSQAAEEDGQTDDEDENGPGDASRSNSNRVDFGMKAGGETTGLCTNSSLNIVLSLSSQMSRNTQQEVHLAKQISSFRRFVFELQQYLLLQWPQQ